MPHRLSQPTRGKKLRSSGRSNRHVAFRYHSIIPDSSSRRPESNWLTMGYEPIERPTLISAPSGAQIRSEEPLHLTVYPASVFCR